MGGPTGPGPLGATGSLGHWAAYGPGSPGSGGRPPRRPRLARPKPGGQRAQRQDGKVPAARNGKVRVAITVGGVKKCVKRWTHSQEGNGHNARNGKVPAARKATGTTPGWQSARGQEGNGHNARMAKCALPSQLGRPLSVSSLSWRLEEIFWIPFLRK